MNEGIFIQDDDLVIHIRILNDSGLPQLATFTGVLEVQRDSDDNWFDDVSGLFDSPTPVDIDTLLSLIPNSQGMWRAVLPGVAPEFNDLYLINQDVSVPFVRDRAFSGQPTRPALKQVKTNTGMLTKITEGIRRIERAFKGFTETLDFIRSLIIKWTRPGVK